MRLLYLGRIHRVGRLHWDLHHAGSKDRRSTRRHRLAPCVFCCTRGEARDARQEAQDDASMRPPMINDGNDPNEQARTKIQHEIQHVTL